MYLTYGWPRVYSTGLGAGLGLVHVHLDGQYLVLVASSAIQIWSGGLHRIKIGEFVKSDEDVEEEGVFCCASWCPARSALAAVVSNLHVAAAISGFCWRSPRASCCKYEHYHGSLPRKPVSY